MVRTFYAKDGLNPVELAACGLDHLNAAGSLFHDGQPRYFDSAGYLAHIAIELFLKACLLDRAGEFRGVHNLQQLYNDFRKHGAPALDGAQQNWLKMLDEFEQLRYPNLNKPVEIGSDNWPMIEKLGQLICNCLSEGVKNALRKLDPTEKSGRRLMRKPLA